MLKRILAMLLAVFLLPLSAIAEEGLAQTVLLEVLERYPGYEVASHLNCNHVHGFVSLHREEDGKNLLVHVKNGKIRFATENAVPQGDPVILWNAPSEDYDRNPAFGLEQVNTAGDAWKHVCMYQMDNSGVWRLRSYHTEVPEQMIIEVYSDRLIYNNDKMDAARVYGIVETDLRYVSLSALPKTVKEAREKLSFPPDMPRGDLTATSIKFTGGQKFDVFSCPDEHSFRGANGKARVSTNDWIQVFGIVDDYILIQYDISNGKYRIGYIQRDALPKNAKVDEISFARGMVAICHTPTQMTDDPMGEKGSILSVNEGTRMTYLAALGEYAYVESTLENGTPIRGFVPMEDLSVSLQLNGPDVAARLIVGSWMWDAGSEIFYNNLTFHEDNTYEYPVTLTWDDTEPESVWHGTYEIRRYDPLEKDYYNSLSDLEIELTTPSETTVSFAIYFSSDDYLSIHGLNREDGVEGGSLGYVRK